MQAIMLTAEASDAGKRMDRFLTERLEEFSRSYLQKLLKEERVLMDGKAVKANCRSKEESSLKSSFRNSRNHRYCRKIFRWIYCMRIRIYW